MKRYQRLIFLLLIISFLIFSFYPTIFELQRKNNLADKRREFVLEHNYYWPDYNLYLSKIRQGIEGRLTAHELYTSELHQGSLIQEFYVALGWVGKLLNLSPNDSYLLGRIVFSPLLLLVIILLVRYYFSSFSWQILAFLVVIASGSFPRIYQEAGITHIGRFMEWWSNIDALQRITFIPHILFAQIVSFYLLYQLTLKQISPISPLKLISLILLGNLIGLTFPPSLITLNTVILLTIILKTGSTKEGNRNFAGRAMLFEHAHGLEHHEFAGGGGVERIWEVRKKVMADLSKILKNDRTRKLIFLLLTLPSLLYIFFTTKYTPWSALIDFHKTHPMMIPFDQYILGTGPILFLGFIGAIISIIKKDKKFQPLIFWVLATFGFAAIFSVIKDQSPLRFTQTGLFIPLGLLGSYLFYHLFHLSNLSHLSDLSRSQLKAALIIILSLYLTSSLYMMKTSLDWQTTWLSQKIGADIPPVPYPPQSMYPLKEWMDGIRWLKNNTGSNDVVLAEITAANYIPAYSGNFVYWGQSNTVDYNRKESEVDRFFKGQMKENEAAIFLKNGRIKYIFFSIQEKEKSGEKSLEEFYLNLKPQVINDSVIIYRNTYNY